MTANSLKVRCWKRRAIRWILTMGFACLPFQSPAAIYIKIPDIDGESRDEGYEGWLDILSALHGVERASGLPTGKRQHKPLTVTKELDKATPLLMNSLSTGSPLPSVILEGTRTSSGGGPGVSYYQFNLGESYVTAWEIAGDAAENGPPKATVTLEYLDVEWHVQELGGDGNIVDSASTYYDFELDEGGVLNDAPVISQPGNQSAGPGEILTVPLFITDGDTEIASLTVTATSGNPVNVPHPAIAWNGSRWELTLQPSAVADGQTTVTVTANDGDHERSVAFSVIVDGSLTPFGGFMQAYFTEEERKDLLLSSPIADPDEDNLSTLLEFLLGTDPRVYTPPTEAVRMRVAEGGKGYQVDFQRRTDEPGIKLSVLGSFDGKDWQRLGPKSNNPIYTESSNEGENPLFESVSGNVTPDSDAAPYMIRLLGEIE